LCPQRVEKHAEEKMEKVRLGRTGLEVSEVGFGGIPMMNISMEEAVALLRHCFELGITFFDTANMYGDSEKKMGAALESVRDHVVLATKTLKRDAEGAERHLGRSLESLKTGVIDLYQLHQVANRETLDQVLAPGGAYETLEKARSDGRIRFIGLSSHNTRIAIEACRTGRFDTIQIPFNFIEQEPSEALFQVAEEMDMGVIGMKPLAGGVLDRADLCFGFLRQYPNVVPIPGMRSEAEADEIVRLYRDPPALTDGQKREMEEIRSELGTKFCRRCEYCRPCQQGIDVPTVLGMWSYVKRLRPEIIIGLADANMKKVEDCIDCGECVERCPYELPIPELIQESLALYRERVTKEG
jgi:predicted aldo/keto reductase-like oxidoreductase